jgi:CubicO group peptidase (beta-lactamase class C family)
MPLSFAAAQAVLERALAARSFPAAVVEVGTANQPLWRHALGTLTYDTTSAPAGDDTIFDLASLTKVLCTTPLVMRQIEHGALGLDDPVSVHLPAWRGEDRASVTIQDLLAHCSGLPAYAPLHRTHRGRRAFEAAIAAMPLQYTPRTQSLYSDLDFILLGFILERAVPLTAQFDALRLQMGAIQDLQFHPPEIWRSRTAPTQQNSLRERLLVGEVDDDNAWALGGAAGHAGLFGSARAVGDCARHLLQVLDWRTGAFDRETLRTFVTRRTDVPGSSRALGWDTMLPTSSCGSRMSASAFGHTGFTGTSLWIDPERGVYVVLLTNRVHPTPGDAAVIAQVRRGVHDAVMHAVLATEA